MKTVLAAIHVGQLPELWSPFMEIIIVLLGLCATAVERTEGPCCRALPLEVIDVGLIIGESVVRVCPLESLRDEVTYVRVITYTNKKTLIITFRFL